MAPRVKILTARATAAWLGIAALVAACGARTGLLTSSLAPEAVVSFDAGGCTEPPWLLFDYVDGMSQGIYAMRASGADGHLLDLPNGPAFYGSVSPDGSKLLYATFMTPEFDGGNDSVLYLYDLASHTATLVVTTYQLTYSALSPDGQTIAYTTGFSVHVIAPDGTNDRTLLLGSMDNGIAFGHPVFTSDSSTVVYGSEGILGAIGVDGSHDVTLLGANPGSFQYPNAAFSPDYTQIVLGAACGVGIPDALLLFPYASLPGATCQSGTVLTDVSEGSSLNFANDPSWGPNGLIAYASGPDVFTIRPSGGTPTNVTAALTGDAGTSWAADPLWAPGCAQLP
jgi:hypothetical protein